MAWDFSAPSQTMAVCPGDVKALPMGERLDRVRLPGWIGQPGKPKEATMFKASFLFRLNLRIGRIVIRLSVERP